MTLACARCDAPLPARLDAAVSCPGCRRPVRALVFPALVRPFEAAAPPERAVLGDESTCFTHAESAATVVCESCGRFLCSLCDLEVRGRHTCPTCLDQAVKRSRAGEAWTGAAEAAGAPPPEQILWGSLALALALVPLLLCLWPSIIGAPLALVLVFWKWSEPRGLLPRSRAWLVAAAAFAAAEIAGWVVVLVLVVTRT